MTRRLLSACMGAAAFVGALEMPARSLAKPPDLPMNPTITATPQAASQVEEPSEIPVDVSEGNTGSLIFGVGVNSNTGLTGSVVLNEGNYETLAMPQEDAPAKKQHKKHHRKAESLPMPKEDAPTSPSADGLTCPYLRQQYVDHHACQLADPEIGRDVLDNLERLKKAETLLELAADLARAGYIGEALACCAHAQDLCPGSPCASRAADAMLHVCFGSDKPATATEEAAEEQPATKADSSKSEPGVEQQVGGLMKACHLLMNEGRHEQAAELARQAFALDPERVMADPLLYKMHLLAETPAQQPAGSSEASEPPSCPYCPANGKPISGIVPEKKPTACGPTTLLVPPLPPVDYEVVPALDRVLTETATGAEEASEDAEAPSSLADLVEAIMGDCGHSVFGFGVGADGHLRMIGEYACGGSVYHLLYKGGCLAIWKTPDVAKTKP